MAIRPQDVEEAGAPSAPAALTACRVAIETLRVPRGGSGRGTGGAVTEAAVQPEEVLALLGCMLSETVAVPASGEDRPEPQRDGNVEVVPVGTPASEGPVPASPSPSPGPSPGATPASRPPIARRLLLDELVLSQWKKSTCLGLTLQVEYVGLVRGWLVCVHGADSDVVCHSCTDLHACVSQFSWWLEARLACASALWCPCYNRSACGATVQTSMLQLSLWLWRPSLPS